MFTKNSKITLLLLSISSLAPFSSYAANSARPEQCAIEIPQEQLTTGVPVAAAPAQAQPVRNRVIRFLDSRCFEYISAGALIFGVLWYYKK